MDVHRCRFVPYQPSAINAIAFSHPNPKSQAQAKIARAAIGRANGDIEIWNPANGSWHQELVIRGGKDRSIDGLVWVNEPDQDLGEGRWKIGKSRLFSIGYTSTVTEWDLEKGKPKRHASGQHGDIWCIAAQPADENDSQDSERLVAGTMDGELVMYSIEDDDLRFQRTIVRSPTKKAQFVSITFQSRKVAIVGCSDSTLRAYDVVKSHMLRRMTLGSDLVGGSKEIIVWSLQCLPNGNIVSGDSTGQLTIWDGKTYTQMQRIQGHKQDILSLAVSSNGKSILSGGMDRRTVLYKMNTEQNQRWAKAFARRLHDHDVKSMASFETGSMSVVLSGGPDSNPVVVPLKEIGRENHRMISSLPQQPPMASASKSRFIVSWWDREVHIWVLRKTASDIFSAVGDDLDLNKERKLLKTIVVKGDSNISDATINEDGTLLVVSTATSVKAFQLEHQNPVKSSDVELSSIELPPRLAGQGASKVQLSPDESWLCFVREGLQALVAKVERSGDSFTIAPQQIRKLRRLKRKVPRHLENGGLGKYDRNITQVAFGADSRVLATADLAGYIDTWVLQSGDGNGKGADSGDASSSSESSSGSEQESVSGDTEAWVRNPSGKLLPKLPGAPAVLSFSEDVPGSDGATDYTLLAITASWNLHILHPLQGSLTPWSKRNTKKNLPAPILDLLDLPKGAVWQGSRVWIYGVSFLTMIDLSQDLQTAGTDAQTVGLKRKRTGHASGAGGKNFQENLAPHNISKHVKGQQEDIDMSDAARDDDSSNSDDDEVADAGGSELAHLRNSSAGQQNGDAAASQQRKSWWMTYKYRPIFGVVKMGEDEVALVERPMWDVEMPERFYAGEEWERK